MAHAIFTARPTRGGRITSLYAFHRHLLWRWTAAAIAWRRRRDDRRRLARLDQRALKDLGIDRALIENDSAVPFWRLH